MTDNEYRPIGCNECGEQLLNMDINTLMTKELIAVFICGDRKCKNFGLLQMPRCFMEQELEKRGENHDG